MDDGFRVVPTLHRSAKTLDFFWHCSCSLRQLAARNENFFFPCDPVFPGRNKNGRVNIKKLTGEDGFLTRIIGRQSCRSKLNRYGQNPFTG